MILQLFERNIFFEKGAFSTKNSEIEARFFFEKPQVETCRSEGCAPRVARGSVAGPPGSKDPPHYSCMDDNIYEKLEQDSHFIFHIFRDYTSSLYRARRDTRQSAVADFDCAL